MKKIYSLIMLCLTLGVSAQLTENNHAPAPGNNFELYECDPTGIDPGPAGAGVSWVFAGTTTTAAPQAYQTITANTPGYPAAKVAVVASSTNTSFYASSPNDLLYYGGNIPVPQVTAVFNYSLPAIKAVYPMSLNTSSTAPIAGSVNVSNLSGTFTGTCSAICDGTGTLTVAGVAKSNIHRVLTTQNISFTTAIGSGSLFQTNFDYYEPDTKAPLFSISMATVVLMGTNTLTTVSRLKSYTGTGINELSQAGSLEIYPNPAINEMKVLSPETGYNLAIFDMTGKQVSTFNLTKGVNRMDVSGFAKGLYVYRIEDKEGIVKNTGKLTLIQ